MPSTAFPIHLNATPKNSAVNSVPTYRYRLSLERVLAARAPVAKGHIYVLRSLSEDPQVSGIARLHKIGFSTTSVEQRIANVAKQPTCPMAPVKIFENYRTYNLKPSALEYPSLCLRCAIGS